MEVDRLFLFGDLNALDLVEFLDATLDLSGFGRLIAKAVDEGFEVVDTDLLALVVRLELLDPLLLQSLVLRVAARVEVYFLVSNLNDFLDRDVVEVAVV